MADALKVLTARLEELKAELPRLAALDAPALEAAEVRLLGRKQGAITEIMKQLPGLAADAKRAVGGQANALKQELEAAISGPPRRLERGGGRPGAAGYRSHDARPRPLAGRHRIRSPRCSRRSSGSSMGSGFARATGPEAETEWYNFGALNFPPDHPAMDMHDTLYLDVPDRRANRSSGVPAEHERRTRDEGRWLLRTHTSPVQIRVMLNEPPPIRVVIPGWVYRKDPFDASHAPVFSQIEGLVVDEGISFVDLKATLTHFAREFFGARTTVRFRPSYFPLHRTIGRDGRELRRVWRNRVSGLQGYRVDGDSRVGNGAPERARQLRARSRALHRVRLRHGPGPDRDDPARDHGHSTVIRE